MNELCKFFFKKNDIQMVFFSNLVLIKNQLMLISYEEMRLKKKRTEMKKTREIGGK